MQENGEDQFENIFLELEKNIKKVVKFPKRFNADKRKEFTLNNKDLILALISGMIDVVRPNHILKKSYRIKKFPDNTEKLEIELFHALDFIMSQKFHSRYNRKYSGWVIEEAPYVEDKSLNDMRRMQEEFLKNNSIERTERNINYLNKELRTYKSKSYINNALDYEETLKNIVHIYDNLRYMKSDGSLDILFTFKRNVFNSGRNAFQTIYWMTQTDNSSLKTKRIAINELNIPKLLEEEGFIKYEHRITQQYYSEVQERKYRLSQKSNKRKQTTVKGNTFTIDDEEWSEDWFSNLTGFKD